MTHSRPDLSGLPEDVLAYIEELEDRLATLQQRGSAASEPAAEEFEPNEAPTTINVITVSASGIAKRTPRHFYSRQRRGGMGVFDLDSGESDPPAFLIIADESAGLIAITNQGRAFRWLARDLPESPVRSRGQSLLGALPLRAGERLAIMAVDQGGSYLTLVSERGQVRRIGSQYLGRNLQPGTIVHDPKDGGAPAAACWSSGADDLLIATRLGRAIRFSERQVPVRGCLGMRVEPDDRVVGVAAAPASGAVFLLSDDGKGTVRLMEGFAANKAPGSGGKTVMKSDTLVGAVAVDDQHDVFTISRLGKIIRFRAADVPAKEGVVQGVNCMSLRADACVALAVSRIEA